MSQTELEILEVGGLVKQAYEGENDTNAFTDAEKAKLGGIDPAGIDQAVADAEGAAGDALAAQLVTIGPERTGAAETLAAADALAFIRFNSVSAQTLMVPPAATHGWPVGASCVITQRGTGAVTVAEGAGVQVRAHGGALTTNGPNAQATLIYEGADEWALAGNLV